MNVYVEIPSESLNFYNSKIINRISSGDDLILTYGGKPIVKIVPLTEETKSDEIFGLWKEHKDNVSVDNYVRNKRKGRVF